MLVLSRHRDETVIIRVPPSDKEQVIVATIVDIRGDKVRTGYEAHADVSIHRGEVDAAIQREHREASDGAKPD